jgi:hypothetical protein
MDLRSEPLVLSVPAVEKARYYSVQFCDGNTFNYGYIGSRATGNDSGDYMVVSPDWQGQTPAGIKKVFRSSTQFSMAIIRTQLFNPDDMPNVVKVQSGYKVQPLSAYIHQPAPPAAPVIPFPKINKAICAHRPEMVKVPREMSLISYCELDSSVSRQPSTYFLLDIWGCWCNTSSNKAKNSTQNLPERNFYLFGGMGKNSHNGNWHRLPCPPCMVAVE